MRPKKTPTVKESAKQVTDLAVDSVTCYKLFFFQKKILLKPLGG